MHDEVDKLHEDINRLSLVDQLARHGVQPNRSRRWSSFHGGHTIFGDGRGTVAEVAQAVADRGFLAFGFSEHFATPPIREFNPDSLENSLAARTNWLGDYVAAVQAAQRAHAGRVSIVL